LTSGKSTSSRVGVLPLLSQQNLNKSSSSSETEEHHKLETQSPEAKVKRKVNDSERETDWGRIFTF
jgi:hypothetical protein